VVEDPLAVIDTNAAQIYRVVGGSVTGGRPLGGCHGDKISTPGGEHRVLTGPPTPYMFGTHDAALAGPPVRRRPSAPAKISVALINPGTKGLLDRHLGRARLNPAGGEQDVDVAFARERCRQENVHLVDARVCAGSGI
jgi:hypothetical protein